MKRSPRPRAAAELSKSLNHQLSMYALATSAAGVGLLALASPAKAKIIYTPAHVKVFLGVQPVPVDLNHDGTVDFYLTASSEGVADEQWLKACQHLVNTSGFGKACEFGTVGPNAMRTIVDSKGRKFAAALRYGEKIQHGEHFAPDQLLGEVSGRISSDT